MSASLEERLQLLEDKQAVYDQLMRYCRGIDRTVPEVVNAVWPGQDMETCKRITDWLRENPTMTMHYVGNCLVEVNGDEATTEAYMIAYHLYNREDGEKLRVKAGRDLRLWKRTDNGWVTIERDFMDEWNWMASIDERAPGADEWVYGQRGPQDAAFNIKEALVGSRNERASRPAAGYPGLKAWGKGDDK